MAKILTAPPCIPAITMDNEIDNGSEKLKAIIMFMMVYEGWPSSSLPCSNSKPPSWLHLLLQVDDFRGVSDALQSAHVCPTGVVVHKWCAQ